MLTREVADTWITRWDAQQEGYIPDREERFTVMIDALEAGTGRPDPLILDLGCGPGSLAGRVLDRIPGATVVAIDTDPLLMGLGRAVHAGRSGLVFTELDLREPGWAARLRLDRQADAAISTTALHWITSAELRVTYGELARVLRPGGLFLNGDNLTVGDRAPGLAALDAALRERETARRWADESPEEWGQWWDAVAAEPALAELRAAREETVGHHGSESTFFSAHEAALRGAGFTEVGTLWQRGDNRVLAALLP
ncbi:MULTISPECIES: class I SAM-dependent methyltransferase [Actinomadura]|uniref:Methyltransferase domain-containing protein n=1 Tax=Actinomadura litoris TaxID=2678616 RepID=A0A7K1KWR4_9ACTN|nr:MULTISPECIES: class I SAM-dependent methyltransferase [Actinomadura]MBT2211582.1 methyltransferase domain-containing protein [Actinomadura sp. NEAU-AAG7]MUN36503.1 methyltransferase domain-containing protein [Actinomadura litoris]